MSPKNEKVKFKYIFEDNYNPKYINGAFGGISSKGEIIINFYLERIALPNCQTFKLENNKVAGEIESERNPNDLSSSFVRVIENGIILDLNTAKEIQTWLDGHIKTLENLKK